MKTSFTLFFSLFALATAVPVLDERAACPADVEALVKGINDNIAVQKMEQSQTTVIQKQLSAADFAPAKSKLIDIINQGASIRANNQKIAPAGNAAIAGLKTVSIPACCVRIQKSMLMRRQVETAQAGELKLAQALTGTPATDNPSLEKLQTMFSGGITQNQKNAKDVSIFFRLRHRAFH